MAQYSITTSEIKERFDLLAYAARVTNAEPSQPDSKGYRRIPNYGGLTIHPAGYWYWHSRGIGGDALDFLSIFRFDKLCKGLSPEDFREVLNEAVVEVGSYADDQQNRTVQTRARMEARPALRRATQLPQPERFFTGDDVIASIERNVDSRFSQWLERAGVPFGDQFMWMVGADTNGATHFWRCDHQQRYLNANVVRYKNDGRRDRDRRPYHLGKSGDGYGWCLYGVWQLYPPTQAHHQCFYSLSPDRPIALVESEKTALVLHRRFPEFIWLASGGANGLTASSAAPLNGRRVFVMVDADQGGRTSIDKTLRVCREAGATATALDLFPDREDGHDLADWVLSGEGVACQM